MKNYHVSITKVFGAALTNTITVEAEDKYGAIERAINANWEPAYNSITQNNMSDSYVIAEVKVDGVKIESTPLNNHLLDEAMYVNSLREETQ
tara:strand:+ start:1120 stop:1395 length:276 start_codon:yes stop_codon:yes gene_type:complete